MKSPDLHPVDDYLLHGRAVPELDARLRDDPKAREELVAGAALDAALSHYFSVIEPSMRAPKPASYPTSNPLRIAALLLLGLGIVLTAQLWRSLKALPLPALASAPRTLVPTPVEPPVETPAPEPAPARIAVAAHIEAVRGGVAWLGRSGVPRAGDAAAAGEGLELAADGECDVRLPEGSRLRLAAGSIVHFTGGLHDEVRLDQGQLNARVNPRPADAPLHLRTPQARVIVHGTEFRLSTTPQETRVQVTEGLVEMIAVRTTRRVLLASGEQAATRGDIVYRSRDGRFQWRLRPAGWE